uniref:Secreted protein n=1 Tax=Glossina palpalis gambiensis TaxID=67801 RepID=A0A1B0BFE8_9MUSC
MIVGKFLSLTILMASMTMVMSRYSCETILRREESWRLCRTYSHVCSPSDVKGDYITAIGLAYLCQGSLSSCLQTEFRNGLPHHIVCAWCKGEDYCKRFT